MSYTSNEINRLIEKHDEADTRVLCTCWGTGDHVDAFREDSRSLQHLFSRLNYPYVAEYAIPRTDSETSLEREIWKQLETLQTSQSVFILYYGGHGEKGGRGRWVA